LGVLAPGLMWADAPTCPHMPTGWTCLPCVCAGTSSHRKRHSRYPIGRGLAVPPMQHHNQLLEVGDEAVHRQLRLFAAVAVLRARAQPKCTGSAKSHLSCSALARGRGAPWDHTLNVGLHRTICSMCARGGSRL